MESWTAASVAGCCQWSMEHTKPLPTFPTITPHQFRAYSTHLNVSLRPLENLRVLVEVVEGHLTAIAPASNGASAGDETRGREVNEGHLEGIRMAHE